MRENNIYDTGYAPEQYNMGYQIRDNSDYTKASKQKKDRKHGVNKHLSPALVAHHHYHGFSDPYAYGYYSDNTNYHNNVHYGMVKDKHQQDKSGGQQPKEIKDQGVLTKLFGKKASNKNKPKDNDDIYAIPRPSLNPGENVQRNTILRNMRQSTGQVGGSKGMVNSKSMGNLNVKGNSKGYKGKPRSSSSSSEEIYESMEDIINRKTILDAYQRKQRTRQKRTGHPLFDHLRTKSQENIAANDRPTSGQQHKTSRELVPPPVYPKADPYSRHAYHYIDDSSDIYSSSNDELEYRPDMTHSRIELQHVPDYLKDEINDYEDVYSMPRFADSSTRKLYPEMRLPGMRYH